MFVLSQASARQPLTEELVDALRGERWISAVSPEVYAGISVTGQALIVRGVELEPFLALEGLRFENPLGPTFLLVGERLAARLGLAVGDVLLLPGSTAPTLMEVTVDGILHAQGAASDEILLDLPRARALAGLASGSLTLLRVGTEDVEPLLAYLAANETDVLVAGEGENRLVQGGIVVDDRIGSLILANPDLGRELGRSYIGAFAQHSSNSLSVLVIGMQGLTVVLIAVMMASTLTRYWVERRQDVGVLRALGGRVSAALQLFGRRLFVLGVLATLVGLFGGVGVGLLLELAGAYTFLGHVLPYALDAWGLLLLGTLYLGAFVVVLLLGLAFLLRQPPRDLLYEGPEPAWRETSLSGPRAR